MKVNIKEMDSRELLSILERAIERFEDDMDSGEVLMDKDYALNYYIVSILAMQNEGINNRYVSMARNSLDIMKKHAKRANYVTPGQALDELLSRYPEKPKKKMYRFA